MKKIITLSFITVTAICISFFINGCAATQSIKDKDGSVLWGENCMRCHNTPNPADYNDSQWEVIGTHMKLRANLTDDEVKKVVEFMKSVN
jgi:cytochrome c1